mmetsp:Transcript_2865/g.3994  ORF Transcript_2865/g.3994 Transcript_2865/m.3994 type:complete len:108 (-) Transcript_2865:255-578(-)
MCADVYIRSVNNEKGFGLFTKSLLKSGAFVLFYLGEFISTRETERRHWLRKKNGGCNFILTVREFDPNSDIVMSTNVDATFIGGDARFINHSCEPNLKLFMYRPNVM